MNTGASEGTGAKSWPHWSRLAELWRSWVVAAPPFVVGVWWLVWGVPARGSVSIFVATLVVSFAIAMGRDAAAARRGRTLTAVLSAFREGDFSVRARMPGGGPTTREAFAELNHLGDTLRAQRLSEMEAWGLLHKVMAEVDVVVLAFSESGTVRLVNEAAARVLGRTSSALQGQTAAALDLSDLLGGDAPRVLKNSPVLGSGPWELRRGTFRLSGETHLLVVLADVSGALRDQERDAWKRLIRVIGHELNNSLAPIHSIAENLKRLVAVVPRPDDWEEDMASGLEVVERRSEALGRFMNSYAQLARLPPPRFVRVAVSEWVKRCVLLDPKARIEIQGGPEVTLQADSDQLDQMLINLLKNAVEASAETDGGVRVRWIASPLLVELVVEDDGPGISDTANLFVPFFTTKPGGSGIGLALARQIAEAHGGHVLLREREGATGAQAVVRLAIQRRDGTRVAIAKSTGR